MITRVLLGTEYTEASEAALECITRLKPAGLTHVVLAHAVYIAHTVGLETALIDSASVWMEPQAERLRREGLEVTTDVRIGVPALVLAEMADRHDVSAIVVGSHGRSLIGRLLLGSVSSGVLHQTRRPVLVVRVQLCGRRVDVSCRERCDDLFERILFPTDFSAPAEAAFAYLCGLVGDTGSAVTVSHVQDAVRLRHMEDRLEEFNRIDQARLDGMKRTLLEAGASEVSTSISFGAPIKEIVRQAGGEHSLVLMGTQGRGAIAEVMVGSVALNVARLAPLPVLFIPSRG